MNSSREEVKCNVILLYKYRTTGSSITINLPSSQSDFVGLTLCAVLSPSPGMKIGVKIWCQCYVPNGLRFGCATTWHHQAVTGLNYDHVFMWCDQKHFNSILKICSTGERQVSFKFFVENGTGELVTIGIRECGVSLIFDSQGDLRSLVRGLNGRVLSLELESHHLATCLSHQVRDPEMCIILASLVNCLASRGTLSGMDIV